MGIEIPDSLKSVASVVATDWPECDETALDRMGGHWDDTAKTLTDIRDEGDAVVKALLERIDGDTHEAIDGFWRTAGGDIDGLVTFCHAIGDACRVMAMLVRAVKVYIIAMLVELAISLAIAAATAAVTFGASLAEGAAAQIITRTMIRQALKELLQRIITETLIEAFKGFLMGAGKELAWQAGETALGLQDGIDFGAVASAGANNAISSGLSAGLGAGLDGLTGGKHHDSSSDSTDSEGGIQEKIDGFSGDVADSVVEGADDDKERLKSDAGELVENALGLSDEESESSEPEPEEPAEVPPMPAMAAPPAAGAGFGLNLQPDTFYTDPNAGGLRAN